MKPNLIALMFPFQDLRSRFDFYSQVCFFVSGFILILFGIMLLNVGYMKYIFGLMENCCGSFMCNVCNEVLLMHLFIS
jgi:hypothetical protein